jgi:Zn-dependent protease
MRIFGFPVQIRPGFALFMLLIIVINGVPMGPWLAGSVAGFTLLHELGHAFAARRTGATAQISLDFLAGYASFTPTRELQRWERAGISLAGPFIQIATGCVVLIALGVNPLSHDQFAADYWSFAIWWAGPAIGIFNLIPVLPLDGGNVAAEILDYFSPGRGRNMMIKASPLLTAGAFIAMVFVDDLRPLAAFAAILLVLQLQTISALAATTPDRRSAALEQQRRLAAEAEDTAWRTGRPGMLQSPQVMSPWWDAYSKMRAGHSSATSFIVNDLLNTELDRAPWWPPHAASDEQLKPLVLQLPRPLPEPTQNTSELSAATLLTALRRTAYYEDGARYGSMLFKVHPSSHVAIETARCIAMLGHHDTAAQWLTIAGRVDNQHAQLLHAVENYAELQGLRGRTDIEELVIQLRNEALS